MRDIKDSCYLPKINLPDTCFENVEKFAGIMASPSTEDLSNDERLARIWNR